MQIVYYFYFYYVNYWAALYVRSLCIMRPRVALKQYGLTFSVWSLQLNCLADHTVSFKYFPMQYTLLVRSSEIHVTLWVEVLLSYRR